MAATIEAVVEAGQIRLPEGTRLPENARVFIVVPSIDQIPPANPVGNQEGSSAKVGVEGDAASAEETEAEADAVLRSMRRRFKRTLEPEVW